jgi:undecaprenyl-phosphate 4-deoxy-4-formamido-L-arabinose transferase|tara:strand:+ start:3622 stop:4554 length:933 start_codon:yes stop_codon:yes gene_type:complete
MISIVIPIYNAEKNIYRLVKKLLEVFSSEKLEIILINDCSPDKSHEECIKITNEYENFVTYIKLGKNMGEHNAVMAGLNYVNGDCAIIMDDDFQNPPEEALKIYNFAKKNNFDVVYGDYRKNKKHNFFRNFISKINDKTANLLLNKPINIYPSSFKCINKKILKHIISYKGPFPYIDGLILSATSNIGSVETQHAKRDKGISGYTILKLLKLYGNLFTNFSTMPIHIFSISGLIIALIGVFYGLIIIIEKFLNPEIPTGYSSLISLIILFSGVQLIFLGLIGEYVGKILKNVNREKQFYIDFIKKKINKE